MASYKCCAHVFVDCSRIDVSAGECARLLGAAGEADMADMVGGLTKVLVELRESECWLSGSGSPCGLRLRLRASREEGDGVNIIQGRAGGPC